MPARRSMYYKSGNNDGGRNGEDTGGSYRPGPIKPPKPLSEETLRRIRREVEEAKEGPKPAK